MWPIRHPYIRLPVEFEVDELLRSSDHRCALGDPRSRLYGKLD